MIWPGSQQFAQAFGRLPYRATTIIEREPGVSSRSTEALIFPMVLNVLDQGGRIFIMPAPGTDVLALWGSFSLAVSETALAHQMRILAPGFVAPSDLSLAE
jgi:hypothetical protein